MKSKPFNAVIFVVAVFGIGILTFISLIAFAAEEEGTGNGMVSSSLAYLFIVLKFPTHTLCWSTISGHSGWGFFSGGLAVNCIFYGVIIERLFSLRYKSNKNDSH